MKTEIFLFNFVLQKSFEREKMLYTPMINQVTVI